MVQKEEQVLFPVLRAGGTAMAARPIALMRMEHDSHARHLHALEALAKVPALAALDVDDLDPVLLRQSCAELDALTLGAVTTEYQRRVADLELQLTELRAELAVKDAMVRRVAARIRSLEAKPAAR